MLKVLLLLALINRGSDGIVQVWEPISGFETMKECQIALHMAYADKPQDDRNVVRGKCIDVSELK